MRIVVSGATTEEGSTHMCVYVICVLVIDKILFIAKLKFPSRDGESHVFSS